MGNFVCKNLGSEDIGDRGGQAIACSSNEYLTTVHETTSSHVEKAACASSSTFSSNVM